MQSSLTQAAVLESRARLLEPQAIYKFSTRNERTEEERTALQQQASVAGKALLEQFAAITEASTAQRKLGSMLSDYVRTAIVTHMEYQTDICLWE